jgi:hypothetical protein
MKRFLLAALALFPLAAMAAQGWFQGSLDEAQAAAKAQKKMLVLKFYADW